MKHLLAIYGETGKIMCENVGVPYEQDENKKKKRQKNSKSSRANDKKYDYKDSDYPSYIENPQKTAEINARFKELKGGNISG